MALRRSSSSMAGSSSSRRQQVVLVLLGAVLLQVSTVEAQKSSYLSDIPGDYCRARSDPCCLKRQDDCSVPILGTRCYCDEFCDRDQPDCCPDYYRVCLGFTTARPTTPAPSPPPEHKRCFYKDQYVDDGAKVKDNCNTCECSAGAMQCSSEQCLVEPSLLDQLRAPGGADGSRNRWGWVAANYSMFWGRDLKQGMLLRTGTKDTNSRLYPIHLTYDSSLLPLPRQFDARQQWPYRISRPRDQGWCGASWAFSTLGVAADRLAIESDLAEAVQLSAQTLVSCDRKNQPGCEGGNLERAWQFLRRNGVVSEECFPYMSGISSLKEICDRKLTRCVTPQQTAVGRQGPYKVEPAYRIKSLESDIQYEIMTNGPVQAKMRVSPDFFYYRSGVYQSSGLPYAVNPRSSHSVRLIGWGEERDAYYGGEVVKYWLASNSWGEDWGEGGLFKIRRGVNEAGIEEQILTVRAGLLVQYPPTLSEGNGTVFFP